MAKWILKIGFLAIQDPKRQKRTPLVARSCKMCTLNKKNAIQCVMCRTKYISERSIIAYNNEVSR
jgi:hypothetical protein